MIWARIVPVFALAMIVGACKTAPPAKPACPERVTTWMACPGPSAKEGSVCQVYGPPLGCGFDEVALDYARHQHTSRDLGLRGRFYVFAIEVTARGASRIHDDEAPQPPSVGTLHY